jgi:hypothetical protein
MSASGDMPGFVRTKRFKANEIYFQTLNRGPASAARKANYGKYSVKSALHFGFVNSLMGLQICVVEVRAGWFEPVRADNNKNSGRRPRRADSIDASSTQRPRRIPKSLLKLVTAAR